MDHDEIIGELSALRQLMIERGNADDRRDVVLDGIDKQVRSTNGRVAKLEVQRTIISVMWLALAGGLGYVANMAQQHIQADRVTQVEQIQQREQTRGAQDWRDYAPQRERR